MRYSDSSTIGNEIHQSKQNEEVEKSNIKNKCQSKKKSLTSTQPAFPPLQVKFQTVDQIMPQAPPVSGSMVSMFFNPLFNHTHIMNNINFNYLNNGIFIPQATENNQFVFIPGNISSDVNAADNHMFNSETHKAFYNHMHHVTNASEESLVGIEQHELLQSRGSSKQIYFVPDLKSSRLSIKDELKDNDDYDTYLVPIKIKKEENGNIELLPEPNWEMPTQQMSADQLNILKKIYLIKNQNKTEEKTNEFGQIVNIDETFIENLGQGGVENGKDLLNHMEDKSQGYVMVRLNKSLVIDSNNDKVESDQVSKTLTSVSLKLSAAESNISSKEATENTNVKKVKSKRTSKSRVLSLSVQPDKNLMTTQATSRFRRLRLDDKTYCWHLNSASCIDTKIRVIPRIIHNLSQTNSIIIPQAILQIFSQTEIENLANMPAACEHSRNLEINGKGNIKDNPNKRSLWKHMCSMNNCEFSKSLTEIK